MIDNSLGEYPKLVDALSNNLETAQGGRVAVSRLFDGLPMGELARYAKHSKGYEPETSPAWYKTKSFTQVAKEYKKNEAIKLRNKETKELALKQWVGWGDNFRILDISASINILD